MGFLDKVKAQAESAVKQGQEKLDEQKAKKKADGLLRDLGAWYYASKTDRDNGQGDAELARLVGELQAHEAEHGPLGRAHDDDEAAGDPGAEAPDAPTSAPAPPAPPPAPPAPEAPAPPAPPAPPAAPPAPGAGAPPPPPGAPTPPAPPAPPFG